MACCPGEESSPSTRPRYPPKKTSCTQRQASNVVSKDQGRNTLNAYTEGGAKRKACESRKGPLPCQYFRQNKFKAHPFILSSVRFGCNLAFPENARRYRRSSFSMSTTILATIHRLLTRQIGRVHFWRVHFLHLQLVYTIFGLQINSC